MSDESTVPAPQTTTAPPIVVPGAPTEPAAATEPESAQAEPPKPPKPPRDAQYYIQQRIARREAREKAASIEAEAQKKAEELALREAAFQRKLEAQQSAMLNPDTRDDFFKAHGYKNYADYQRKLLEADGLAQQSRDPRYDALSDELRELKEERQKRIESEREQQQRASEESERAEVLSVLAQDLAASPQYSGISKSEDLLPSGEKVGPAFQNSVYQILVSQQNNPDTDQPFTVSEAAALVRTRMQDAGLSLMRALGYDVSGLSAPPVQGGSTPAAPGQTPVRTTNLSQGAAIEAGAPKRGQSTKEWLDKWANRMAEANRRG